MFTQLRVQVAMVLLSAPPVMTLSREVDDHHGIINLRKYLEMVLRS